MLKVKSFHAYYLEVLDDIVNRFLTQPMIVRSITTSAHGSRAEPSYVTQIVYEDGTNGSKWYQPEPARVAQPYTEPELLEPERHE